MPKTFAHIQRNHPTLLIRCFDFSPPDGWQGIIETLLGDTHHCPAWASVHSRYQADIVSAAFASRCEDLVAKAHLWIHGHTHASVNARIGDIPDRGRIVCNPRGYPQGFMRDRVSRLASTFENPEFDRGLVVEIYP